LLEALTPKPFPKHPSSPRSKATDNDGELNFAKGVPLELCPENQQMFVPTNAFASVKFEA
jgi:hypothetical protein